MLDLNHGSAFIYGKDGRGDVPGKCTARINAFIDAALIKRHGQQQPRDYLGASRIGEACARRLVYEITHTPKDPAHEFDGRLLRIFDAGHQLEALSIQWLRAAGFELLDRDIDGQQFAFIVAGGRLRGHADGVIVGGPDVGIRWPTLFEHKALSTKSWNDLVKRGLRQSKPIYFAQVQLYMAYLALNVALLTALNRDTLALYHEVISFDPSEAQRLSDRAVEIILGAEAGELPPRAAARADCHLCRFCPHAERCWKSDA